MPSSPESEAAGTESPTRRPTAVSDRRGGPRHEPRARRAAGRARGPLPARPGRPRQLPQARRARDRAAGRRRRREALLRDWLEVLDSVERALACEPDGPVAEGLRAVLDQMEASSRATGVQRIGAVGEPFDPERHERSACARPTRCPTARSSRSPARVRDRRPRAASGAGIVPRAGAGVADGGRIPRLLRGPRRAARRERRRDPPRLP